MATPSNLQELMENLGSHDLIQIILELVAENPGACVGVLVVGSLCGLVFSSQTVVYQCSQWACEEVGCG